MLWLPMHPGCELQMQRSASTNSLSRSISRTATAIKESKAGKAIARNRVFKWIAFGINYDM